jgi:threonylcarbamoyladenosine tRNA methylthiotransferase MtaB
LKVSFHTLGCKLNFSETSTIARSFDEKGFEKVKFGNSADVIVINTCSVTGTADKKCRQAINKAKKNSPEAFIVVTGCYAQLKSDEISKMPGVDVVLGMQEKFNLFDKISEFKKKETASVYSCEINEVSNFDISHSSGDRTRSFLKIQDGCDYPCTYCTIPKARGKSRNGKIEDIILEAQTIVKKGFKEIILTGVNIGDFGKTTDETFFELLQELEKVEGIERYRISSIEPNLLTDEIITLVSNSKKILPHFHIPLQTGNNKLLKLMKRRYMRELFEEKIISINKNIPEAFIGVDVIVGFPDETDKDFLETYNFIEKLDVSFLHVFSYSDRDGTPASTMENKISAKEIEIRSKKLHELSDLKHKNFYIKNIGKEQTVLFEAAKYKNSMFGFTDNYIKVEIPYDENLINKIKKVKIISVNENGNALVEILDKLTKNNV